MCAQIGCAGCALENTSGMCAMQVKKSVRKEATHNVRIAEHHMGYEKGFPVSVLTINGILYDANRIDPFTLSAQLRSDTALMWALRKSGGMSAAGR